MRKAPTIHELAADLGISATTVWRAFQEKARIGAATRARILARAKALGYVPSQVAQNLSQGRTRTLGLIVPSVSHPFFGALVERVEEEAFRRGYGVILGDTRLSLEREAAYARMFLSRRVEGVLAIPFAARPARGHRHLDELRRRGVPVVLLEQALPGAPFPSVVADNFGAARAMTRHLVAMGHRRIAFVFHPVHAWDAVGRERLAGFQAAMAEARLKRGARAVLDAVALEEGEAWSYRPGPVAACFQRPDRPTALFAGMDALAIQAVSTLRTLGLEVPRDVAVAGFDDIEFSRFAAPPLTTVAQPVAAMADRAAALLFERIERGGAAPRKPEAERLPCRLVVRASCGSPYPNPHPQP